MIFIVTLAAGANATRWASPLVGSFSLRYTMCENACDAMRASCMPVTSISSVSIAWTRFSDPERSAVRESHAIHRRSAK
jgi:hypothetical protein